MDCLFFDKRRDISKRYLLIYDISDNCLRTKFAKLLEGYGIRVQKSVFEVNISKALYHQLLAEIKKLTEDDDSVRIYSLREDALVYGHKLARELRADVVIV